MLQGFLVQALGVAVVCDLPMSVNAYTAGLPISMALTVLQLLQETDLWQLRNTLPQDESQHLFLRAFSSSALSKIRQLNADQGDALFCTLSHRRLV